MYTIQKTTVNILIKELPAMRIAAYRIISSYPERDAFNYMKSIKCLVWLIQRTNKYKFVIADPIPENIASISVLTNNGFIKQRNGLYKLTLKQ